MFRMRRQNCTVEDSSEHTANIGKSLKVSDVQICMNNSRVKVVCTTEKEKKKNWTRQQATTGKSAAQHAAKLSLSETVFCRCRVDKLCSYISVLSCSPASSGNVILLAERYVRKLEIRCKG